MPGRSVWLPTAKETSLLWADLTHNAHCLRLQQQALRAGFE